MDTFQTQRRASRILPGTALVICFPSGNRGIVLNISPGGLGFLAGAPIEEDEPVRFTISSESALMTEAAGELIWKDSTAKRAGVRFTHVPEGLRTLIRQSQHERRHNVESKPSGAAETTAELASEVDGPSQTQETQDKRAAEASEITALFPARKKFGVAANAMTASLALFVAAAIWFPVERQGWVVSMKALERDASQLVFWGRSPRLKTVDSSLAGARDEGSLVLESRAGPAEPVLPHVKKAQRLLATNKRGRSKAARLRSSQNNGDDVEDGAESPESLWQAVEKGSSAAEVKLADMYLQAKGVAKSCGQAKVLLGAAQRQKSALAERKLADLAGYGCE
jgi:hypothetical protein